jgi:hypothetical protein
VCCCCQQHICLRQFLDKGGRAVVVSSIFACQVGTVQVGLTVRQAEVCCSCQQHICFASFAVRQEETSESQTFTCFACAGVIGKDEAMSEDLNHCSSNGSKSDFHLFLSISLYCML